MAWPGVQGEYLYMNVELKDTKNLVIAATGFGNKLMVPTQTFMQGAGFAGYSKIILFDPAKTMFLCGVPGIFDSFDDMVAKVRAQIAAIGPERVIVVGTSGGGHTALLLGHLLKADICVAFSPYPYLSDQELARMNDPAMESFRVVLERVRKSPQEARKYLDVKDTIREWNGITEYFVHVSESNEWDVARANTLADIPHLQVVKHPGESHAVVTTAFVDYGLLSHCFRPDQQEFFKQIYTWLRPVQTGEQGQGSIRTIKVS